ncbi:hypothetical protein BC937DRAFT_95285 [Endogone sp. FLAS-F59071]|nr:hypothetical protein BC937DRAFT_95285 [Endogone sp. FLAS-F59071]|eukprot:RUS13457.1 hypothetical protein BC937DRAFT_95285 [Endogone sp. FLAS-F59071]
MPPHAIALHDSKAAMELDYERKRKESISAETSVKPVKVSRRKLHSTGDGVEKTPRPRKKKDAALMAHGDSLAQKRPASETGVVLGEQPPEKKRRRRKAEMQAAVATDGVVKEKRTRKTRPPEYDEDGNVIKRKRQQRKKKLETDSGYSGIELSPSTPKAPPVHGAMATLSTPGSLSMYNLTPSPHQSRHVYQPYQLPPLTTLPSPASSTVPPASIPTTTTSVTHVNTPNVSPFITKVLKPTGNATSYTYYSFGSQPLQTSSYQHPSHTGYYNISPPVLASTPPSRPPPTPVVTPTLQPVLAADSGSHTPSKQAATVQLSVATPGSVSNTPPVANSVGLLEREESVGGGSETETDEEVSLSGTVKSSDTTVGVEPSNAKSRAELGTDMIAEKV